MRIAILVARVELLAPISVKPVQVCAKLLITIIALIGVQMEAVQMMGRQIRIVIIEIILVVMGWFMIPKLDFVTVIAVQAVLR